MHPLRSQEPEHLLPLGIEAEFFGITCSSPSGQDGVKRFRFLIGHAALTSFDDASLLRERSVVNPWNVNLLATNKILAWFLSKTNFLLNVIHLLPLQRVLQQLLKRH